MDFVDEENSGYKFCNTLIDVFINDLVDLLTKFISNFSLLWFHNLTHEGDKILSMLGTSIRDIEIMKSNILNDLLLLVDVSLW